MDYTDWVRMGCTGLRHTGYMGSPRMGYKGLRFPRSRTDCRDSHGGQPVTLYQEMSIRGTW